MASYYIYRLLLQSELQNYDVIGSYHINGSHSFIGCYRASETVTHLHTHCRPSTGLARNTGQITFVLHFMMMLWTSSLNWCWLWQINHQRQINLQVCVSQSICCWMRRPHLYKKWSCICNTTNITVDSVLYFFIMALVNIIVGNSWLSLGIRVCSSKVGITIRKVYRELISVGACYSVKRRFT